MIDYNAISIAILPHLESILQSFGINYTKHSNRLTFPCPLHNSSKNDSISLYTTPSQKGYVGNWVCFTNNCHEEWGRSILGLIRGLLSSSKVITWKEVIKWCQQYIDKPLEEYNIDVDKYKFVQTVNTINKFATYKFEMDREFFRDKVDIPAQYFVNRGFSSYLLDKYDVGLCTDKDKSFYNRVLVPIYDPNHKKIVSVLARSIHNKCNLCGNYHDGNCKDNPKWLNAGFVGNLLYNYWFSKNYIRNSGTCIMVEGCGDVWKLEEAGIYNSVALCSNKLTYNQQMILEKSGATRIILALDSDEKGREGAEKIIEKLQRSYKIINIVPEEKDIGDMSIDEIKKMFHII